ncbi:MAG TPA: D-2-hydroxyacid dehydrogenase [Candidatus Onthenecus intestinigallinarum]|uniref:D-2-hydroxyacid dehydrogenase n=1 Tax=Candidatus Onthenecus intestinigallinarum TaxID=2840875 RepID=A0A9D0Z9K7_9FIRM|nr:D-2-hydroxyacid dehydrogenase [Candidatus Onthenecus intestinigallinarum]
MKIVVLDGYTENPGDLSWGPLQELGELTVYDRTPPEAVLERIGDAEAIYTNKTVLSRELIQAMPSVRFIGVLATGYNVVDVQAARERGIVVCNIPTYGTDAVAQYVFALLLELCHRVAHHAQAVQEGRWTACPDFCFWDYPLIELSGKTMGIVGYGRIGQRTAQIARAFGMQVLAYDAFVQAEECVPLDELLERSDVVSLHCPLFPETKHIIRGETIARMKDGAILINTSRGPLVDEAALREALTSGKLYGAAVDVVSTEPVQPDNPLLGLENCLITPHIAWAPRESRQRLMDIAVENLRCFLRGAPQNIVG